MKIEMHTHTSEVSPCSHVSADNIVKEYYEHGYNGIVITDHYSKWVMDQTDVNSYQEFTDYFLTGYHAALKAARKYNMTIFCGAEICINDTPNDYLLYGACEEFFLNNHALYTLSLDNLYSLCHKNNILLFQAHPSRPYCEKSDVRYLDGAEVYNGNPRHSNNNDKTAIWCNDNNLLTTSGSDYHELEDIASGGIETFQDINTEQELADVIKNKKYTLITQES